MESKYPYATAVLAALLTHRGFQHQEPTALQFVCWTVLANLSILAATIFKGQGLYGTTTELCSLLLKLDVVFFITLLSSVCLYRGLYHPLRAFPGPFWAKITKLWTCRIHLDGEYHRVVRDLHRKYGDFLRVGPNELDINDVPAIKLIYGSNSKFMKGPWYDGPSSQGGVRGIQSTVNHAEHRWKRGIWAQSSSVAAINEFQPLLLRHVDELVDKISMTEEFDIGQWFTFLSFDIMGDLAFGESFDMLTTGTSHRFMIILHGFMRMLSLLSAIPWLTSLVSLLPSDLAEFETIAQDCMDKRRTKGSSRKDIFYYLLGEDKETGTRLSERELVLDSRTAIVGGSDTTSISLGCLFYYLILHQDKYKRLQAEVLELPESLDNITLGALPFLNAVIQEALRLMPPVPQGLQRIVPAGGVQIAGKFIPEATLVSVSPWTVQRDSRNFSRPDEFIPERWLGEGAETCNKDAWIPFSIGNYGCIGKQLALSELRHITSAVVRKYDLQFAPGFNVAGFEKSVTNDFTMTPPCVRVVRTLRA